MTTVISRVYASKAEATRVSEGLAGAGFPASTYEVIAPGQAAQDAMISARVPKADAPAYKAVLKGQAAMVVIRAPLTPFGAARKAIEIADSEAALRVEVDEPNVYIREQPDMRPYISVLTDHPRWFSGDIQPGRGDRYALLSEAFSWPLLSKRRPRNSAMRPARFMSQRIIKQPLLTEWRPQLGFRVFLGGKRWFYNP